MIVAKNDEAKRSKIWKIVTVFSSVLIIVIAIFLLTRLFTANPLEGTWIDEDGSLGLSIKSGSMVVSILELAEETNVAVKMNYTMDKDEKTITISINEAELEKQADKSDGRYTKTMLESALSSITTTFEYSVEQERLILTEREYGDQMIFIKE